MEQEMKQHTEKMDVQLLEEKRRGVKNIVSKNRKNDNRAKSRLSKTKEKEGSAFDDEEPLNEYMAGVLQKRKDNKAKLKSLGLGTPPSQSGQARRRNNTPKKTPKEVSVHAKKTSPPRKRTKTTRKIFDDDKVEKICTLDHKDISSFKEETDKRYFAEVSELYETKCSTCNVEFTSGTIDNDEAVFIPDNNNPAYFCIGRWKYNCKHGHCQSCYLVLLNANNSGRPRRNR